MWKPALPAKSNPPPPVHERLQAQRGDLVDCLADEDARLIARGLANYSALETAKIAGQSSLNIEEHLGYVDEPELIHRDNMVLV